MSWPTSQILVAGSAVIVASCAAAIAYLQKEIAAQQMKIARLKLNHDLFDKRFAVYIATYDFMIACLNREGGTREDSSKFYEAGRIAPFLFDKTMNDFLAELWRQSIKLQVFGPLRQNPITPEAAVEYNDNCHKALEWISKEFEKVTPRFQKILDLSNIEPFAIKDPPSPDDAEKLRIEVARGAT